MTDLSIFMTQAASSGVSGTTAFLFNIVPILLVFVVFYFLLIRPQAQRAKQHRALIEAVKVRDTVVTSGGIVGKVTKVDDIYAEVEIASGVKVKVVKATLSDVTPFGNKPAND
jgi:preprotein translocase subunit YajC